VDIWAIGVITYFLLCGYTPFDRDTQQEEMQAIINRDFKFEPGACAFPSQPKHAA
jgi:calcium/calmodulin-dependent protein kinase I